MQTVTDQFTTITASKFRESYWRCLISFLKTYSAGVDFFTIGVSTIGGTDIIKGTGSVVQEWDKYNYEDYTDRIMSIEYTREQDPYLGGGVLSMADIVLDNHDDFFTPGAGSSIDGYILPKRPVRLYLGFKNEAIPIFVGIIEGMPVIDDKNKTVKFHCIDFMQALFNYPLDKALISQNQRTDQIISTLLQLAGITSSQMSLDTGFNIVPFFFADKGDKLGDYLRQLAGSEMGRIYMDEQGMIKFVNRSNWVDNTDIEWVFDDSNIINRKTVKEDGIINVVEVKSDVREVLAQQKFFELSFDETKHKIPAGGSKDIWADFSDPVTACDDPEYVTSATTSLYTTNGNADGSGENLNSHITLNSTTLFAKSFKMTFSNDHTLPIYITGIELYATPAKITKKVYARVEDETSVSQYDEKPVTIQNNFIQEESTADSIAQIVVTDNKDFNELREIDVIGVPQLQIGDLVTVTDEYGSNNYYVSKIVGKLIGGGFTQTLTVIQKTINTYFRIGISTIGGNDQIAP